MLRSLLSTRRSQLPVLRSLLTTFHPQLPAMRFQPTLLSFFADHAAVQLCHTALPDGHAPFQLTMLRSQLPPMRFQRSKELPWHLAACACAEQWPGPEARCGLSASFSLCAGASRKRKERKEWLACRSCASSARMPPSVQAIRHQLLLTGSVECRQSRGSITL